MPTEIDALRGSEVHGSMFFSYIIVKVFVIDRTFWYGADDSEAVVLTTGLEGPSHLGSPSFVIPLISLDFT